MELPHRSPSPREQQREETRRRLFEAAIDEFKREGFDRASVAAIAKRAGVSRPSFYFHYPTKDHVLLDLQWSMEVAMVERVREHARLAPAMRAFVDGLIESEERLGDPALFRDMTRVYARRPEGVSLGDQPFPLVFELGRRFAEAAQSGELRAGLDPAQSTLLFLTSVFGYLVTSPASPQAIKRGFFQDCSHSASGKTVSDFPGEWMG